MKLVCGNVKISVFFEDIIGLDDDYFLPRFEKALVKGNIKEWCFMGIAFDSYLVLEYDNHMDLINYLKKDMNALESVLKRNIKRVLPRSESNERKIINSTCVMGTLCDEWISKGKENR